MEAEPNELEDLRPAIANALRSYRQEIERAVASHLHGEGPSVGASTDSDIVLTAIRILVGYCLDAVERDDVHGRPSAADGVGERSAVLREAQQLEVVRKMLSEESVDATELADLGYGVHARWHLGLIAKHPAAGRDRPALRVGSGGQMLTLSLDAQIWIWQSGRERMSIEDIERRSEESELGLLLAVGEPGWGMEGWRLTHHQARAALGVAVRNPDRVARYTDHRLVAAALQNDTLAKSLAQKYICTLRSQRDGGAKLRQTLRAHIDAGCVASAAASALRVDRHTVEDRLRTAERLLGCPLRACLAELDVALRVEELGLCA